MISVVIPVYNQPKQLEMTLSCFANQKIDEQYELIVVDDCSDIKYDDLITKMNQEGFRIQLVRNHKNMGRSYTRNRGIERCFGEIIVFCDADRYPVDDFLNEHLQNINSIDSANAVSIGHIIEDISRNPYDNTSRKIVRTAIYYNVINHLFDQYGRTNSNLPWIATLSGNMAIRGLSNYMKFDEDFEEWGFEHFELGYRMYLSGFKFMLCREATNCHIAHKRSVNFYEENMRQSLRKLKCKHPELAIELFEKFILGEISLQDFENSMGKDAWWCKRDINPIYNKLVSF